MGFQKDMNTYLNNKLNEAQDSVTPVPFELKYRYALQETDFMNFVFRSIDWENPSTATTMPGYYDIEDNAVRSTYDTIVEEPLYSAENNVVVEYDGVEHNTQKGEYAIVPTRYVPCIIEDFVAEFQPLAFIRKASYTIPITFYVDEVYNFENNDVIVTQLEAFQDLIRGQIETVSGYRVLFNHGDIRPYSGVQDFNGRIFREYQLVVYAELVEDGFFANEIEFRFTQTYKTSGNLFDGETTTVQPIAIGADVSNDIHSYQKFNTTTNNEYYSKGIPSATGYGLELSFIYRDDELSQWLYEQKYNQTTPEKLNISIKYPNTSIPIAKDYVVEHISGLEQLGQVLVLTVTFRPVDGGIF